LIREEIVLGSPGRVVIDRDGIIFYLVDNVDLVGRTQVELLGGDARCANQLETTDFVSWGDVGGLPRVLRVLTLCESRPEGTISGRSGLDEVVDAAGLKGGVPFLLSSCGSGRENKGGY
jgi:hypothetical protein